MIAVTIPGTKIWRSKAGDSWNKQLWRLLLSPWLSLGWSWGQGDGRDAVVFFRLWQRGRVLPMEATAEVWWTAASQGVELPQLVPQEVPQGGTANRAAEAGQLEVATGAARWREVEGVIWVVPFCFHDGGEPGFLQDSKYKYVQHK